MCQKKEKNFSNQTIIYLDRIFLRRPSLTLECHQKIKLAFGFVPSNFEKQKLDKNIFNKLQNSGAAALLKTSPKQLLLQIIQFDQTLICDDGDAFCKIRKINNNLKKTTVKKVNKQKNATTANQEPATLRRRTKKKPQVDNIAVREY